MNIDGPFGVGVPRPEPQVQLTGGKSPKPPNILDIALVGSALVLVGLLGIATLNPAAEAYKMAMEAQCASTVTAAAVIELSGASCSDTAGHVPAVVELCRLTHGRTAAQVANLPQCRRDADPR